MTLFGVIILISSIAEARLQAKEQATSSPVISGTVGYQQVTVPDPNGKPLQVGIWYPTAASASRQQLGLFQQTVAPSGSVSGDRLPLVLISHGVGGSLTSHYDTALALAQAGFVVAALTHTGDNFQDQSYVGNQRDLIDRPRQISLVLDFMFGAWPERKRLDPTRVGMFGFSLGGFTALVTIGGIPDLSRIRQLCSDKPEAPECRFIKERHGDQLDAAPVPDSNWIHDTRIKAAVVAAPALGITFAGGGLRHIKEPVQLWRAEDDQESPNPWNSDVVREGLPTPPEAHNVTKAGHFGFLAPCSQALAKAVPRICHDAPGFDRSAFHQEFNRLLVAFLRTKLGAP